MKKIFVFLFTLSMMIGIGSLPGSAIAPSTTKNEAQANTASTAKLSDAEAQKLVSRLYEIKGMDKSKLTHQEKRQLRQEVIGIRHQLKQTTAVIYISAAAIIIIILLIILL